MMNALERRSTFALSSIFALRMLGLFMIIPVFSVAGQTYEYATPALLGLAVLNLVVAGISLRVGGQLAKGPYLPQTLEGLTRTTRAVLGR